MSDFDRNVAARGTFAGRAAAVDAGLRAHMIRVYNYMTVAVALTGLVAWFTFQAAVTTNDAGGIVGLTPFGQAIFSGPLSIVLMLGTLGLVFFISFRINRLQYTTALGLFMIYAALLGLMLSSIFLAYTGASITRVFFISAASFGALSLWGYTTQRDLTGMGSFLIMGLFGIIIASAGEHLPEVVRARLDDLDPRRRHLRRPHRLRHAEDQGDVLVDGRRHRRRPQGRDGRAVALPRLHQPVPDAAAAGRRPPLSQQDTLLQNAPARRRGGFLLFWREAALQSRSTSDS